MPVGCVPTAYMWTDRRLWKQYLPATSLAIGNINILFFFGTTDINLCCSLHRCSQYLFYSWFCFFAHLPPPSLASSGYLYLHYLFPEECFIGCQFVYSWGQLQFKLHFFYFRYSSFWTYYSISNRDLPYPEVSFHWPQCNSAAVTREMNQEYWIRGFLLHSQGSGIIIIPLCWQNNTHLWK